MQCDMRIKNNCWTRESSGNFIIRNNINVMNNGAPARIVYNSETAIDLTLCTASIAADIHWSVAASPGDSDHCPIFLSSEEAKNKEEQVHLS